VVCIIRQKILVRKLFVHINPSVGYELFGEQNNKWRPLHVFLSAPYVFLSTNL
jgi:hypothetical protein